MAEPDLKAVRIRPGLQAAEAVAVIRIGDRGLPVLTSIPSERIDVEPARGDFVALLEAAGEIGGGIEAARERDVGKGTLPAHGPILLRHQADGPLQANTLYEFIKGFAHERVKDAMKVKGRKTGDAGNNVEPKRLVEIPEDVINGAVNAIDVVRCSRDR